MAFWGVEVKPDAPFTHRFHASKGRLHVSLASLGFGSALDSSTLKLNIGNTEPRFLCALFPNMLESQQLNLEFEEVNDVVFSVVGPRSIHLTGYYMEGGRYRSLIEKSARESFGEHIGDTNIQRSGGRDGDKYGGTFLNDDDLENFPSRFSGGEKHLDDQKLHRGKGNWRQRPTKSYQPSESDDEGGSLTKQNFNGDSVLANNDNGNPQIVDDLIVGEKQMRELAQTSDDRPKKKKRDEPINKTNNFDVQIHKSPNDDEENRTTQDDAIVSNAEEKNEEIKEEYGEEVPKDGVAVNLETPLLQREEKNSISRVRTLKNGLVIEVLKSGKPDGKIAVSMSKISVRYVGKFKETGEVFDSSTVKKRYKFCLGSGRVIDGWEIGLEGMQEGEKRRLTIPPSMGYGGEGDGKLVPPDAWLVYEIELVKVSPKIISTSRCR